MGWLLAVYLLYDDYGAEPNIQCGKVSRAKTNNFEIRYLTRANLSQFNSLTKFKTSSDPGSDRRFLFLAPVLYVVHTATYLLCLLSSLILECRKFWIS